MPSDEDEEYDLEEYLEEVVNTRLAAFMALPPAIRIPEREYSESIMVFLVPSKPGITKVSPSTPKAPKDGSQPRATPFEDDVSCQIVRLNYPRCSACKIDKEEIPIQALHLFFLHPLFPLVLGFSSGDLTAAGDPGLTPRLTQPNSLAFGDVVLYRAFSETFKHLREQMPTKKSKLEVKIRSFDLASVTSDFDKPEGGHGKSLVYCASKKCLIFGKHRYRCSRCLVAYYCVRSHQIDDWNDPQDGGHKAECKGLAEGQKAFNAMCGELFEKGLIPGEADASTLYAEAGQYRK